MIVGYLMQGFYDISRLPFRRACGSEQVGEEFGNRARHAKADAACRSSASSIDPL
jgi:hypothetical protein